MLFGDEVVEVSSEEEYTVDQYTDPDEELKEEIIEEENAYIDVDVEDEINSKPPSEAIDSFRSKEDSFVEEEIEQEMP
jgi:hypothetical protein